MHLVSHRVASPLSVHPNVVWHRVPRPFGRHVIGSPLLDRRGRRVAKEIARAGGTVVVNGGNCLWNDVNWVHYVHNVPVTEWAKPPFFHRQRMRWTRRLNRLQERQAVGKSRLIITDSDLTKERLIVGVSLDPGRVRTIYYGIDPERFRPANAAERSDARRTLGCRRTGPWWPSSVAWATTAAKASTCFSTPGADAAWRLTGTRPSSSRAPGRNYPTGDVA